MIHDLSLARPIAFCHLHLHVALGHRLALVGLLAAAADAELDLHPAVLEVQRQRDEREVLDGQLVRQLLDLAAVHQQLARAVRVVGADAVRVWYGGMCTPSSHTWPLMMRANESATCAWPSRSDFTSLPRQHDAGLERLEDVVVAARATVAGDELAACWVAAITGRGHGSAPG